MAGSDDDEVGSESAKLPPALRADPDAKTYIYRDFSDLPDDPDSDNSPPPKRGNSESSIRVQKFPVKLYAILSQKEFSDIVTWMPHGRSWKVLKPNLFESLVMPLFFEYSNYHSFNRLVNAWSFRRISAGPDRGSYYHELFLRGKPHLQKHMRRLPKTHKKLVMKKEDEPDFYKMDETNPLPELEETPANMLAMRRQAMAQAAAINSAPQPYASAHSMNPALAARLPGMAIGYPGSMLNRPMPDSFVSEQATLARLSALDPSMAALGAASLPSAGAASLRGRSSLGMGLPVGMPAAAGLPPQDGGSPQVEAADPSSPQHYQYQRMRHLQHLQMFQNQMAEGGGGAAAAAARAPPTTPEEQEMLMRQFRASGSGGGSGGAAGGAAGAFGRGRPPFM